MSTIIPTVAADFENFLNASVSEGDTTTSLNSITDTDGVVLANGYYGFTVDNDTDYKEYILCTLTGTALSNIFSISDQGVATAGFANYHRRGAVVQITDHVSLLKVIQTLTGVIGIDNAVPLYYAATPTLGSSLQLATVQYVLDHAAGGAVSFNAEIIAGMAGETITIGQWVYLKESDGRWYKTDATDKTKCLGVKVGKALGAGTAGGAIASGVFVHGLETVGTYAAFTTYYLSDTPGALATSAGTNSVAVGISDGNSKLIVSEVPKSNLNAMAGTVGTPSTANRFLTQQNEFTNVDQSQTSQDTATGVGEANATTKKNKDAQSFIPTGTKMRGANLYKAADTGSFTGTVTVALQADSAGSPSGVALATVTILNASWLKLPVGEFTAIFGTEYGSLVVGSLYWIVVSTSTSDNSNHPNLGSNSAGGYANGTAKYNNTTDGWVSISGADFYFKTLGGSLSQVPLTDSTTGFIPAAIVPNSTLLMDVTAGTSVSGVTIETTSYSSTFDSSVAFAKPGAVLKLITNVIGTVGTAGATVTYRLKMNGQTLVTYATPAGSATSTDFNAKIELYIYTSSTGNQTYSYTVIGGTNSLVATASTQVLYVIIASGRGTLSTTVPPSATTAILLSVQPSSASGVSGQELDMLIQQM